MNSVRFSEFIKKNFTWALLLIICAIFAIFSDSFLTVRNILNIVNQNSYLLIAACGVAILMMSGKMDLSIGYASGLTCVTCARLLTEANWPVPAVVVLSIVMGMVLVTFTVVMSHVLDITHIYVSFGTMTIYQGLAYIISESKSIGGFPPEFKALGQAHAFSILGGNVTYAMLLMVVLVAIMSVVLNKTYFGRYVFAIGGNKDAARLAGINVKRMEILIGILCGGFSGLASLMLIARIGSAAAASTSDMTFTIITGLLLGGVSIRGGEGSLGGCVAGIFIVAILGNGMMMVGLNTYFQYVVKGLIMLLTIGIDNYQLKRRNMKKFQDRTNAILEHKAAEEKR